MIPRNGLNERPPSTTPVPDPTVLTNELVTRAVSALRDVIEAEQRATAKESERVEKTLYSHIDNSLAALDKLSAARSEIAGARIEALIDVVAVFKTTVNERFELGAEQTDKAARDVKSAVDAAFAAAKEAVGEQNKSNALSISKSDAATIKQIDQLTENLRLSDKNTGDKIDALRKTSDDKFTDMKDRLVAMESRSAIGDPATSLTLQKLSEATANLRTGADVGVGARTQSESRSAWMVAAVASAAAIALVLIEAFNAFRPH